MRPALYYHAACTLKGTLAADDDEVIAEALQAVDRMDSLDALEWQLFPLINRLPQDPRKKIRAYVGGSTGEYCCPLVAWEVLSRDGGKRAWHNFRFTQAAYVMGVSHEAAAMIANVSDGCRLVDPTLKAALYAKLGLEETT